jgi:hypothetical protein
VANNPINYTDPTGHYYCPHGSRGAACINDNPDPISILSQVAKQSANIKNEAVNLGKNIVNGYPIGWKNFGTAIKIASNPHTKPSQKFLANAYIGVWGGAHLGAVAGVGLAAYGAVGGVTAGAGACAASQSCEEKVGEVIDNSSNYLYRGLANGENPLNGLWARSIDAGILQ